MVLLAVAPQAVEDAFLLVLDDRLCREAGERGESRGWRAERASGGARTLSLSASPCRKNKIESGGRASADFLVHASIASFTITSRHRLVLSSPSPSGSARANPE